LFSVVLEILYYINKNLTPIVGRQLIPAKGGQGHGFSNIITGSVIKI
jgi:hypothetical protein